MNKVIFLIFVILMSSLVLSVSIDTDKDIYESENDLVTIEVTGCEGLSFVKILNSGSENISMDQGEDDWELIYNTNSDGSDGVYTAEVSCGVSDGTDVVKQTFCVGTDACSDFISTGSGYGSSPSSSTSSSTSTTSSSSSSGGGSCDDEWSCTEWSFCSLELQQTRTCSKTNSCSGESNKPVEIQDCEACLESWVCDSWEECYNDQQSRSCVDEHFCGTQVNKPDEVQVCDSGSGSSSEQVVYVSSGETQEEVYSEPKVQEPTTPKAEPAKDFSSIINSTTLSIAGGVLMLFILIGGIIAFVSRRKFHHAVAENTDQLELYVKEEMKAGMDKEFIRKQLEHAGWNDQEISDIFSKLDLPPVQ